MKKNICRNTQQIASCLSQFRFVLKKQRGMGEGWEEIQKIPITLSFCQVSPLKRNFVHIELNIMSHQTIRTYAHSHTHLNAHHMKEKVLDFTIRQNVKLKAVKKTKKNSTHFYKNRIIDPVSTNNSEKKTDSTERERKKEESTDGIKQIQM